MVAEPCCFTRGITISTFIRTQHIAPILEPKSCARKVRTTSLGKLTSTTPQAYHSTRRHTTTTLINTVAHSSTTAHHQMRTNTTTCQCMPLHINNNQTTCIQMGSYMPKISPTMC